MKRTDDDVLPVPGLSFWGCAAWFSLVVPVAAVVIVYLPILADIEFLEAAAFYMALYGPLLLLLSLILGVVSLAGFGRHRQKNTVWIALLGVLASIGTGAFWVYKWTHGQFFRF